MTLAELPLGQRGLIVSIAGESSARRRLLELGLLPQTEVDLILCDLMMPEMNGMDLHHEVSRVDPDVARRFVFLTGGAYTDSARVFLAQVNNPKLDKPIQPNLLRSVVHTVLRG